MSKRVLVLGATGHFGGRIVRALLHVPEVVTLAAGRSMRSLQALAERLGMPDEHLVELDPFQPQLTERLRELDVAVVIHTVGPFQLQSYDVARCCMQAGVHYIDLADGRDFVKGFSAGLYDDALAANILAVSGASTLPALSSAVVDAYAGKFDKLEEIEIVIAPAQRTPRGPATVGAVLSYCGKPFTWLSNGRWVKTHGWQGLKKVKLPMLGERWAAACDVPDLALLPERYDGVRSVQFRAALELAPQHGGLWLLAGLRRLLPFLPLEKLNGPLGRASAALNRFGTDCGGMTVTLRGTREGKGKVLIWYVVAEQNEGPQIPCLAAELVATKLARGELDTRGAMACMGLLTLADFNQAFKRWPYHHGVLEAR